MSGTQLHSVFEVGFNDLKSNLKANFPGETLVLFIWSALCTIFGEMAAFLSAV